MKDLEGRLEAEALAGSLIDLTDMDAQLFVGDLGQVGAFGQVLA